MNSSNPKILYISTLCSVSLFDFILETSQIKPSQAVQKFHRLIVEGLSNNQFDSCDVLSSLPVTTSSHKKRLWWLRKEKVNNVTYKYIPILNLPVVKNFFVFIFTLAYIFLWILSNIKYKKVIICDVLNLTITTSALLAAKFTRTDIVSIVTDLPGLMVSTKNKAFCTSIITKIITKFDGYILLTSQMNSIVNPRNKPFLIMEGLVDKAMGKNKNLLLSKANERILLYAGGIYEKYGVKNLIDAFTMLKDNDLRLHIYGTGDMEKKMNSYMLLDSRIVYKGIVSNDEVVKKEIEATLLVNPRPTNEEFTKYSFPSKNLEYMVSGTPLLTTKLQGMPKEYYPFVYLLENETVAGTFETLQSILSKSRIELHDFGNKAKEFVLNEKSNIMQSAKIMSFLNTLQ